MRTFDRARPNGPGLAHAPTNRSSGPSAPDRGAPLTPEHLTEVQRDAGNRAANELVTLQRSLSVESAETIARRVEDAISGPGTDEEAIYGALTSRTPSDLVAIREAYRHLFDVDMDAELADDLSESELLHLRTLYATEERDETAGAAPAAEAAKTESRAREIARQLHDAMKDWGTEEDQIFNALEGRSQAEIDQIGKAYTQLTSRMLETDLRDELSGGDLERALELLGVADSGAFANTVEQKMTEGATTVVKGDFEWAITPRELRISAPVKFVPDEGATPPFAEWYAQIGAAWNKFAATEPGGRKLPIQVEMRDDPGCDREIAVHKNSDPVKWWLDRANAAEWYEKMKPSTAPHEFGHYIGLPDEYQRTHGDIKAITGADPGAGIANGSGKTPEQIAESLHAALTKEDATLRAPEATTLLTTVGLIDADGVPQQGDFAQAVKKAYDAAHSPTLVDTMRDNLPKGSKWTIQTVFSYATRTMMGNPEGISKTGAVPLPHDHAVEPRHMREFLAIVKRTWPKYDWSIGSK